jgi:hypothetical protein
MRCYNGAPDSALQAVFDSRSEARRALKKADPTAWCTYFPSEHMYSCARWIPHPDKKGERKFQHLTEFHSTVEASCAAAIEKIQELDSD